MMNKIQSNLRDYGKRLLPLSLYRLIRRLYKIGKPKRIRSWSGNFKTFREALDASGSLAPYDLAHKTTLREAKINLRGNSSECDKSTMLMLGAMAHVLDSKSITKLNVLDLGGGLGHFFFELCKFLPNLDIEWDIIDTPTLVERGNKFEIPKLRFFNKLNDIKDGEYDMIIVSGSLQYFEFPYSILDEIASIKHRYLFLTKHTELETENDRLTLQRAQGITAPYWFFSKHKLHNHLNKFYKTVMEWDDSHMPTVLDGKEINMRGYLFKKL